LGTRRELPGHTGLGGEKFGDGAGTSAAAPQNEGTPAMKVSELIAGLEEFQTKLTEHEERLGKRAGQRAELSVPEKNVALQERSRWLSRRLGALRPYIERFDDEWIMQHPASGATWDALHIATSLTGHPGKNDSLSHVLPKLHQILGRLENFDPNEEIPADPTAKPGARSLVWRELKDFLEDRLHLSTDEFNRVSIAGIATANRLEEMLDNAAFAFLILTAEDEQPDGRLHARLNVVHEAGLFQGKLGFKRAIILREETCEEFSNIHGLGQIHFPAGKISAASEDIRRVLEREGLIVSH